MKQFNKKTIIVVIVSVIIIPVLIFAIYYSASVFGSFTNPRIYYANFADYEDDFKNVCAWAIEYSDGEDVTLIPHRSSLTDEDGMTDSTNDTWVALPDDVAESLCVISKEAWGSKTTFTHIKVKGSRVYFCCEEYPYYVVYSPKGKPWRAFGEWVFSERICRNWYHVSRN